MPAAASIDAACEAPVRPWVKTTRSFAKSAVHHLRRHAGVGIVCAVSYFDPGNWGVDLQAGSRFGYRLLFVVLLAGLFAVFLQCLASKLGCVTGLDLASHCRLLLHDRPKHKILYRWMALYPLYVLSEIAIIATDLAELLGSAIALVMLFPSLELWHGVLITAFDVLFILLLGDPLRGRPVRSFEYVIAGLVFAVLICMVVVISKVDVDWSDAFEGYIPSKYILPGGALYTSVGILGATVMPHSLFLGSALATQDRVSILRNPEPEEEGELKSEAHFTQQLPFILRALDGLKRWLVYAFKPTKAEGMVAKRHRDWENHPESFIKAHFYHGLVDIVFSLLGFAVIINSLILILASAVFYFGNHDRDESASAASLFDAHDLIRDLVGKVAATLFALALLAAGQSSSIIATVAGQAVSEGFLRWTVSPVLRRLLTRLLAVIPSMAVAIIIGRPGIDALLVASQVVLSVCLPFITFPLLFLTTSRQVMQVRRPNDLVREGEDPHGGLWIDYSNGWLTTCVGGAIWLVVMSANIYVLVSLAMGQSV